MREPVLSFDKMQDLLNQRACLFLIPVRMSDSEFRAATCLVRPCSIRRLLKRGTELRRTPKVVQPQTAGLEGATRPQMPGEMCRTTVAVAVARGQVRHLPLAPPTNPPSFSFLSRHTVHFPPPPPSEREATFGPGALFASGAQKVDCRAVRPSSRTS